jgi:uncharacterized protein (DUF2336 family)
VKESTVLNTVLDENYEQAKALARDADPAKRRAVARRADVRPELLYYLANDASAEVRREIGVNDATPVQANLLLAKDPDLAVRGELAKKVGRLLPNVPPDTRDQMRDRVLEVIEVLARDKAAEVREVIASAIKDTPDAPAHLVKSLAMDAELSVAGPVLRYSPLLTDQDLLDIIANSPAPGASVAIAERANVAGQVADAIVRQSDENAVTALLANPSAQIREETLDLIVEQAPRRLAWHQPLVERPQLPGRVAQRISTFVAEALVEKLASRPDLPAEVRAKIAAEVKKRLQGAAETKPAPRGGGQSWETPEEKLRRLQGAGKLNEDAMHGAIEAGERPVVRLALAAMSGLNVTIVDKILTARSAKGVVALAWRAGLTMRSAVPLQVRMGGIAPAQVLNANDDAFPMEDADMTWQIEFFGG